MAEIFARVRGMKFERAMALVEEVQNALDDTIRDAETKARALLAAHRVSGDSDIETAKGKVDRYLVLSDERGLGAAMSIEFGRLTGDGYRGEGVYVLHDALGVPHE